MWLKKYMKIEHLQDTLKNNELYMGKPENWSDKNDAAALKAFARHKGWSSDIRVTCLTRNSDRYHFWDIYGKCEEGVCLWYDFDKLLLDIKHEYTLDPTLGWGPVRYYTVAKLLRKCHASGLALAKRKQYHHENEFRIFRQHSPSSDEHAATHLKFQPESLRRIYLNPWIDTDKFRREKAKIKVWASGRYKDLQILHNQTLKYDKWIRAVDKVADEADSR